MTTQEKNGITEGVIWKQLLIFFFPILVGSFFQQLYNTADSIIKIGILSYIIPSTSFLPSLFSLP